MVEDSRAITIDGREGRLMDVDVAPTWTATCEEWAGLTTFVPLLGDGRRLTADRMVNDSWWLGPGGTPGQPSNPLRIILLDLGDSSVAAIFIAAGRPADQDALLERAMPVVESFRFAD